MIYPSFGFIFLPHTSIVQQKLAKMMMDGLMLPVSSYVPWVVACVIILIALNNLLVLLFITDAYSCGKKRARGRLIVVTNRAPGIDREQRPCTIHAFELLNADDLVSGRLYASLSKARAQPFDCCLPSCAAVSQWHHQKRVAVGALQRAVPGAIHRGDGLPTRSRKDAVCEAFSLLPPRHSCRYWGCRAQGGTLPTRADGSCRVPPTSPSSQTGRGLYGAWCWPVEPCSHSRYISLLCTDAGCHPSFADCPSRYCHGHFRRHGGSGGGPSRGCWPPLLNRAP